MPTNCRAYSKTIRDRDDNRFNVFSIISFLLGVCGFHQASLKKISGSYNGSTIITGGEFNCRIG